MALEVDGLARAYEVTHTVLPGRRGRAAGRLLVLRDVTERSRLERRLRELLERQARTTAQLSCSLRPSRLPEVPGLGLAARFRPAGGPEIGGDFYDVVAVGDEWAVSLGDVSGKGPQAAAVTAHARYTLRTLVQTGARPAAALRRLHAHLVDELDDETYLTVVHARLRPGPAGTQVALVLGGHPPAVRAAPRRHRRAGRHARHGDRAARGGGGHRDGVAAAARRLPGALHRRGLRGPAGRGAVRRARPCRPSCPACAGCPPTRSRAGCSRRCSTLTGAAPVDDIAVLVLQASPAVVPAQVGSGEGDPGVSPAATPSTQRAP